MLGRIGGHASDGLRNAIANVRRLATIAAGVTAGLGVASVKAAADFQDAMTKSLAIMGTINDDLRAQMERAARDVAKSTTFSANQAAEAYFFLASAGLDAQQSLKAMPVVAKFAQAGNFDLALATDLLTDAQSALGMTIRDDVVKNMENMIRVSDVLVKANTLANATVQQFSEALTNKAGAALRLLGKDVEEGVAVLAAFADQGVKGAEAGEKLSIVMRDLQRAAIKHPKEFRKAKVAVFDAKGEMRSMADIVDDLSKHLGKMSDEQKRAALMALGFQDKSVSALQQLLGTGPLIRRYEEQLRKAGGTTEEVANKQLQSFSAQLQLLKSNLVDIGISIGLKLLPGLTKLTNRLREFLATNGDKVDKVAGKLGDAFDRLVTKGEEFVASVDWGDVAKRAGDVLSTFKELGKEVLPAAVDAFKSIPWSTVADSMKIAGEAAAKALQMFKEAPDWLKTAVVTGWGLNKLTGGAFGKIVGELGAGLIKGVLGINAGVVNITAGTVKGPGGGIVAGGGGLLGGLARTGSLIAGGALLFGRPSMEENATGSIAGAVGGGALAGFGLGGPLGAIAGGLAGLVAGSREALATMSTQQAQQIADRLAQQIDRMRPADVRKALDAVEQGIRDIKSNPLLVLVQGDALTTLKQMRDQLKQRLAEVQKPDRLARVGETMARDTSRELQRMRQIPTKLGELGTKVAAIPGALSQVGPRVASAIGALPPPKVTVNITAQITNRVTISQRELMSSQHVVANVGRMVAI
jgi:TP901 family phage tail tape measure protein